MPFFTLKKATLLTCVVVCLVAAGMLLPGLRSARSEFAIADDVMAQMPPELVLGTTLLGGFRGLLVDAIWIRAGQLLIDGKFWELVQLYDLMGKLQPHLDSVWCFNGWNMAFNVAGQCKDSADRWEWIWRAVESLRDEGLKYNPRSLDIHRELAWVFFEKMGQEIDEHNRYYKHRFALMVMDKLKMTGPRLNVKNLAGAPNSREVLNQLLLLKAGEPLHWFFDVPADVKYFDVVGRYMDALGKGLAALPEDRRARVQEPTFQRAWATIENFLIADRLRTVFKMDPKIMLKVEEKYGEMDWRLPDPHAIYWCYAGVLSTSDLPAEKKIELDRITVYALSQLYRRGFIAYMDDDPYGRMIITYNLKFLDPVDRTYRDLIAEYRGRRQDVLATEFADSLKDGHTGTIKDAMRYCYFGGPALMNKAVSLWAELRTLYPNDGYDQHSLDEYMVGQIKMMVTEWGDSHQVEGLIEGLLVQALLHTGLGDFNGAAQYENYSRAAWEWYANDFVTSKGTKPGTEALQIPKFEEVYREVIRNALNDQYKDQLPQLVVNNLKSMLGEAAVAVQDKGKGSATPETFKGVAPLAPAPAAAAPKP